MMKLRLSKSWNMIKIQSIISKHLSQLNDLKKIKINKNLPQLQFLALKLITSLKSKEKMAFLKLKLNKMKPRDYSVPILSIDPSPQTSSFLNIIKNDTGEIRSLTPKNELYRPPSSMGARKRILKGKNIQDFSLDAPLLDHPSLMSQQSNMILHFTSVGSSNKRNIFKSKLDGSIVQKMQRRACRIFHKIILRKSRKNINWSFEQLINFEGFKCDTSRALLSCLKYCRDDQDLSLFRDLTKKKKSLFLDSAHEKNSIKDLCGTLAYFKMKERSSKNYNSTSSKSKTGIKFFLSPKKEILSISEFQSQLSSITLSKKDTLLSIKAKNFMNGLSILNQFETKMKSIGFL